MLHVNTIKMFEEEPEEDKHNPDDEKYETTSTTATPKCPTRPRKRTRSETSADALLVNSRDDSQQASTSRNRKQLNKKERSLIIKHIKNICILPQLENNFQKQECPTFGKLLADSETLSRLLQYHQKMFVILYEANATGKDKFISFQLQWHKHCSILLLPKEHNIQCIFSPPTKEMVIVCQVWFDFVRIVC